MAWLFIGIEFVALGALMFAVASAGACLMRSFGLARRLAQTGTLAALASLAVVLAVGSAHLLAGGSHDAARARSVAETIAELLNCVVFALPAALVGAVAWVIAARKLRSAPRGNG
jgi:hypothetical protein